MKVSRRWLEGFLGRPLEARDVADRLGMLGAPVDAIEPVHQDLRDLVVARVEAVRPHPNADRLRICTVDDGGPDRWNVVCGAPNVVAGANYPFARVGATLPGGLTIERRKLRGEVSEGMLCSGRELGLSDDHDGLFTLDAAAEPGTALLALLAVDDDCLVVDVTPNRADLNGHKGVARELAASLGVPFRLPVISGSIQPDLPPARRSAGPAQAGPVEVAVAMGSGCSRFLGAVIRGVTIAPSPLWLRARLEAVGLRAINNVVDATNYVMLELNQPLHAYDLATLGGGRIEARAARNAERLRTLDGAERALEMGMPVIADAHAVIGVAGVMGGQATEVTDATTDIFLECAWFEPARVRAARRALGLSTEASYRFERGTDLHAAPDALRRALELLLTVAGGSLDGEPVDVWPEPAHPPRIFLRLARLGQVLGAELPPHVVERALVAIGATVVAKPEDGRLAVEPPGWRPDLREEIDLVEEVARIHGYDQLPDAVRAFRPGGQVDAPGEIAADRVRDGLIAQGLLEAVSLSMGPVTGEPEVRILNPLSVDHAALRSRLLPGLVRAAQSNWDHHVRDLRLFELGTVFHPGPVGRPPEERIMVAGIISGARQPRHWTDPAAAPECDRWDLKALFEAAVGLAYPGATVQVEGVEWLAVGPAGAEVGRAGRVLADAPPWAAPLWGFELELHPGQRTVSGYRPVPVVPAIERDVALLLPESVAAEEVRSRLAGADALVESVTIIDEFRGEGLPPGRRSVAFRVAFRAADRTLRDGEVDPVMQRALAALERERDVTLRTT